MAGYDVPPLETGIRRVSLAFGRCVYPPLVAGDR